MLKKNKFSELFAYKIVCRGTSGHLELLSLDGKVIYGSDDFTTEFYQIDISTFSQGGYYMRLIADGEVLARQKIVIN
jgi:hypothetical protein